MATCLLWLLGVEVLPDLHLFSHDDQDHTHAADGTIVRVAGGHEHGHGRAHGHGHGHGHVHGQGHGHSHSLDAAPAEAPAPAPVARASELAPRRTASTAAVGGAAAHLRRRSASSGDQPAFDLPISSHAAAGIAHHALALHRPPPPLLEPLAVLRAAWRIEIRRDDQISHAPLARPTARGPPAVA